MSKTDQMVMEFQSPATRMNFGSSWTERCTPSFSAAGDARMLQPLQFESLVLPRRSFFHRWQVQHFTKMLCRAAVDCLAMAGCVLFAALATLLFGL